ncbi:MAG TPA: hypothetical protein VGL27_10115 [Negativicutes bacterium]
MKHALKRIIIFAAIILVQKVNVWAASNLPCINTIPSTTTFSIPKPILVKPPLEKKSLPNEIPVQIKEFPPLQPMHFNMVPTFKNIPVSDYVDGANLYHQQCSACHGLQSTSSKKGVNFTQMTSSFPEKHQFIHLDQTQLRAIVDALGGK